MKDEDVALYTGFLRLELHQTKSFIMVERIQLNELLNDKKYDRMDCNSSDCAVEIGKLVGIKKVITGSFNVIADTCIIAGQLIDVESKETENSVGLRSLSLKAKTNERLFLYALDAPLEKPT